MKIIMVLKYLLLMISIIMMIMYFLLGFNKENIPVLYKDNEYFSDKEKRSTRIRY